MIDYINIPTTWMVKKFDEEAQHIIHEFTNL